MARKVFTHQKMPELSPVKKDKDLDATPGWKKDGWDLNITPFDGGIKKKKASSLNSH